MSMISLFYALYLLAMPQSQDALRPREEVTVEASRLAGNTIESEKLPQPTIVITRDDIERTAGSSVAEILAVHPEIVAYDQVGNGVEAVIDLRGFNEGTAAAVFLDGARINEPDDNRVLLSQVPLEWVDRIEVFKGPSSSVLGGGALSGAIRIYTRPGTGHSNLAVTGGSYSTGGLRADWAGSNDSRSYRLAGGFEASTGFRDNGESREGWALGSYRKTYRDKAVSLMYSFANSRFGSPGSLLESEIAEDRYAAPFNQVDENAYRTHLLSADLKWAIQSWTLSGTVFARRNDSQGLTTGRSAALWGGFSTDAANTSVGTVLQASTPLLNDSATLTAGTELTWVGLLADGYYTTVDGVRTNQASSTDTNERWAALFAQLETSPTEHLTLVAGVRYDHQALHFDDVLAGLPQERTTFGSSTFSLGASYSWSPRATTFANFGTAFQPPTILDLFAYPLFFSNPDLKPSTGRNVEAGQRLRLGPFSGRVSLYNLTVDDEVIFVSKDPSGFTGRNENAGRSRRRGMDLSAHCSVASRTDVEFGYSYVDARFMAGPYQGRSLVMIPRQKGYAGVTQRLGDRLRASARLTYTGSRYVVGDEANIVDTLPAFTMLDIKATYQASAWKLEATFQNALDGEYYAWGITDMFHTKTYYIPAPPLRVFVTMAYEIGAGHR